MVYLAALDFLLAHSVTSFTEKQFEEATGIGVEINVEQIEQTVSQIFVSVLVLFKKFYIFQVEEVMNK